MKAQRQGVILQLIKNQRVHSQEQLRELLRARHIDTTQATLSRDIHELRLVKISDADGDSYYAPPLEGDVLRPSLEQMLSALLVSLEGVGNMLVLRTPAGSANTVASALDRQGWSEVLGTLAGDDTILVIARSERARRSVARRLKELAGLPT